MIMPTSIREDIYGASGDYCDAAYCETCGKAMTGDERTFRDECVCEDCQNKFDIDDVLRAYGCESVADMFYENNITEYLD